jgi:hypothetical protein
MHEIGEILLAIERETTLQDGLATVPEYLMEQLHNQVFPDDRKHDYTGE